MAAIAMPFKLATNGTTDYTDNSTNNKGNTNKGNNAELSPTPSSGFKNGIQPKVTYEDPDADVALKSNEGRIFKVESYVLKTHSAYFRQQFKSGIPHDPIPVDASTKILKGLLDIMHMRPVPSGMVWAYKDKLLKLADQLGTPSVAERAVFSMHDSVHKDPWGVFCLASQRGQLSLAKAALRALADTDSNSNFNANGNGATKIDRLTPALASGVTLPYLLGLFNAALTVNANGHTHGNGNGNGNGTSDDFAAIEEGHVGAVTWKAIADKFAPVVG